MSMEPRRRLSQELTEVKMTKSRKKVDDI